jgi:hypothetical protein
MDSDVHIAEFFVYDSAEMMEGSELKKINLSHMQRLIDQITADDYTRNAIIKCVERYQYLAIVNGKLPRVSKSIAPTQVMLPPKVKKVSVTTVPPVETPLKPMKLSLDKTKQA